MGNKKIICPVCKKKYLEFRESSFEQYEPSVYYCDICKKFFNKSYIHGYVDCQIAFDRLNDTEDEIVSAKDMEKQCQQ